MRILNLHGLFGDGKNTAYNFVFDTLKYSEDFLLISPDIMYEYENPIQLIDKLYSKYKESGFDLIVGTSFGGFFATKLAAPNRFNCPCIVINPCIAPQLYVPELATNPAITYMYKNQLEKLDEEGYEKPPFYGVIIGSEDDIIDHKITLSKICFDSLDIVEGQHRLKGEEFEYSFGRMINYVIN